MPAWVYRTRLHDVAMDRVGGRYHFLVYKWMRMYDHGHADAPQIHRWTRTCRLSELVSFTYLVRYSCSGRRHRIYINRTKYKVSRSYLSVPRQNAEKQTRLRLRELTISFLNCVILLSDRQLLIVELYDGISWFVSCFICSSSCLLFMYLYLYR